MVGGARNKLQGGTSLSRIREKGTKGTEIQRLEGEFAKVGGAGLESAIERFSQLRTND